MAIMSRKEYAAMYGPTVGDGLVLGDTSLVAVIEKDYAVYGDECLHGGGKTLRDGAGMAAGVTSAQGALDLLLCNVVVIDAVLGVVKGDLGIKNGQIVPPFIAVMHFRTYVNEWKEPIIFLIYFLVNYWIKL